MNTGLCESHLWVETSMVLPSPTCQIEPSLIRSLAASRLCHTQDGLLPSPASMKVHVGKYLDLYTLQNKECVSWISRHACFANKAQLKAWMSQNPIPSFFFGVHNFFQLIQWIFFSSFVCPHQYFVYVEFMISHSTLGILNILIVYVGIA